MHGYHGTLSRDDSFDERQPGARLSGRRPAIRQWPTTLANRPTLPRTPVRSCLLVCRRWNASDVDQTTRAGDSHRPMKRRYILSLLPLSFFARPRREVREPSHCVWPPAQPNSTSWYFAGMSNTPPPRRRLKDRPSPRTFTDCRALMRCEGRTRLGRRAPNRDPWLLSRATEARGPGRP